MWLAPQVLCHLYFCSGFALLFDVCISVTRITDDSFAYIYFNLMESNFLERGEHVRLLVMIKDKWHIIFFS